FLEQVTPEFIVVSAGAVVFIGKAGDEDIVVAVADEAIGPFAADNHVSAAATDQLVIAVAADKQAAAIAGIELIVACLAIEPGGIGNGAGDPNVVVASATGDDDPAAGQGNGRGDAVEGHFQRGGTRAWLDHDRVAGRSTRDDEGGAT